jgi:hypothetical protein
MTYQSPRIYIYKITFEEVPYYYYGVKKEEYYNQEYWGSPKTNKWCWELYTPKKQILEVFEFSDGGWLEAQEVEKRLIQPVFNTDKWCLNESCGGRISLDILRENGKKYGKIGGIITGNNHKKNKTGFFAITDEQKRQNRIKANQTNKENNTGIYGISTERRSEISKECGKKGGNRTKELGVGFFSMSREEKSNAGKKGGTKAKELGVGIHKLTTEERREIGRNGVKKSNSQKWKCLETGHISTPTGLTRHQKNRGIDTSKRVRVS